MTPTISRRKSYDLFKSVSLRYVTSSINKRLKWDIQEKNCKLLTYLYSRSEFLEKLELSEKLAVAPQSQTRQVTIPT